MKTPQLHIISYSKKATAQTISLNFISFILQGDKYDTLGVNCAKRQLHWSELRETISIGHFLWKVFFSVINYLRA